MQHSARLPFVFSLFQDPHNKRLAGSDVFSVNQSFTSKFFRLKVNSVQLKETKEEHRATSTRVLEDRQYALDACIVRVMKARKTLQHNLLMAEVLSQAKFPTKPPDVKKRIASLIEREYIERDKNDSSVRRTQGQAHAWRASVWADALGLSGLINGCCSRMLAAPCLLWLQVYLYMA